MRLGEPATETDRLNDTFRPTAHNAFDPAKAPSLTSVLQSISSIEIDFWDDETAPIFGAIPHTWFVRHLPLSGNVSNGRPPGDLRACLTDVRDRLLQSPTPDGTYIFLDKQQGWGNTRRPSDLDALLVELFGNAIFKPADLSGILPTPRQALLQHGWCSQQDLSGRVCLILTGGRWHPFSNEDSQSDANSVLATYVNTRMGNAACFVAPEVRKESEISGLPPGFAALAGQWVVMFNNSNSYLHLSEAIYTAGFMSRVYFAADSDGAYQECIRGKVNFIAIDSFGERTWNGGLMKGRL